MFGNAQIEGASRWGWFLGHFITGTGDPRSTSTLEVKWTVHKAGEGRERWAKNIQATTLSILIQGRFCLQFPEQTVWLSREGDYALWGPGILHTWYAEEESTVLTVRWPSLPGDSVGTGE